MGLCRNEEVPTGNSPPVSVSASSIRHLLAVSWCTFTSVTLLVVCLRQREVNSLSEVSEACLQAINLYLGSSIRLVVRLHVNVMTSALACIKHLSTQTSGVSVRENLYF